MLSLPQLGLEVLVKKAHEGEGRIRDEIRAKRRAGFFEWHRTESASSVRALYRRVREGPRSMQSTGIFVENGFFFAGQAALLAAGEQAWWPLWQQDRGPAGTRWCRPELP